MDAPTMKVYAMGRFALRIDTDHPLDFVTALIAHPLPGVTDIASAETSVLLRYDRPVTPGDLETISTLHPDRAPTTTSPRVDIDVTYNGADLREFADTCSMSVEALIDAHQSGQYRVAFCGFAPGFAYLVGLDPRLHRPRRSTPRVSVPAGSLAVAGHYTAVYPQSSPGGWHLLGSTQMRLFNPDEQPPSPLTAGSRVQFHAVREEVRTLTPPATMRNEPNPADTTGALEVLSPGPLALVQDLGRRGLAQYAVGMSGAWDVAAHTLAQRLVGNHEFAAGCECVGSGLRLLMHRTTTIAITGAPGESWIESPTRRRRIDANSPHMVHAGEIVHLGPLHAGLRRWLAVRGGIDARSTLGSRSYDTLSGLGPAPLAAGDHFTIGSDIARSPLVEHVPVPFAVPRTAAVIEGPDSADEEGTLRQLLESSFTISVDSNRVGVRLLGPTIGSPMNRASGPSHGLVRGAIQIPPDGQPVVMGPDHPVTGGYPVIAVLADPDSTAQWVPGGTIRFHLSR
jgi:KipI family sensor histidine kinase inhibitor